MGKRKCASAHFRQPLAPCHRVPFTTKSARAAFSFHPSHPPTPGHGDARPASAPPRPPPNTRAAGTLSCGDLCLSHINSTSSKPAVVDISITRRYHRFYAEYYKNRYNLSIPPLLLIVLVQLLPASRSCCLCIALCSNLHSDNN